MVFRYVSLACRKMGRLLGITVKRVAPCWCLDGHVKTPLRNVYGIRVLQSPKTFRRVHSARPTLTCKHLFYTVIPKKTPHWVAFYDTLGIRRTHSRLKTPAFSRGYGVESQTVGTTSSVRLHICAITLLYKWNIVACDIKHQYSHSHFTVIPIGYDINLP